MLDDGHLGHIETQILSIYLPKLEKTHRKAIRKLCKEKGIKLFDKELQLTLTNLLASVIRHRETDYDSLCREVGKERARFYTQPIIEKGLKRRKDTFGQGGENES